MSIYDRPTNQVGTADLQELLDEAASENVRLEFKRDVPVIVQVVDSRLFKATESLNLAEGLAFQPGLRVEADCQNCGFTQVRLNGMDGSYSQILIDGKPIFSALNTVYGLEHLPAA